MLYITFIIVKEVKWRCQKFLKVAADQLAMRMPANSLIYHNAGKLSYPSNIFKKDGLRFDDLPFKEMMVDEDAIETQLRLIKHENFPLNMSMSDLEDPIKFGVFISNMKSADGSYKYRELGMYLLSAQVLPVSNAFVESIFSIIGWVKNKHRNRLNLKTLNAIMRVKVR